jgi:DNA adenine methylase
MNPLVKWTGGKRSEIAFLKPHYPAHFTRIVEPFAGGAAVAWDLEGVPAVINDVNTGLIAFYRALQDSTTRAAVQVALQAIGERRQRISTVVAGLDEAEVRQFFQDASGWINAHLADLETPRTIPVLDARLEALVRKHGRSKPGRIAKIEATRGESFGLDDLRLHLETALQSAWYEALREVYNGVLKVDAGWAVAAWWAVRVLCYSGMFRFGKNGHFNVPYGGIGYNKRDFSDAGKGLFGEARVRDLARFTVESMDFAALFAQHQGFTANDFLFVDPPYDSTFSQYNVEGDFTRDDQVRLRDTLEASPARWMVVIKRTDFIEGLYAGRGHHCYVFDKSYAVNFRNRHDRGVQHLVVTNYPLNLSADEALRPL